MGGTALLATILTSRMESRDVWFVAWMMEAALAGAIGVLAMLRKTRIPATLIQGPGRKFTMSLFPALAGAVVLTGVLYHNRLFDLMPGVWLLLYGVAIMSGGTYSVKVVPLMGAGFMAIGTFALLVPWGWAQWCMAAGFGGLQIIFGTIIARRHGG